MNSLILSVALDGLLTVLLTVTIIYCSKLSRRIRMMQDSRSELAAMIGQFDQATERATASLSELQAVSKRITDALQLKIEKANFLADDLAFLIEKSAKTASQLEQAKKQTKPEITKYDPPKVDHRFEPLAAEKKIAKPYFESTVSASVSASARKDAAPASPSIQDIPRSNVAASLEAVLQRLASGGARESITGDIASVPRTAAERDLIAMLKTNS